ncbi:MAG: DUF3223 domain-containing protein [Desulfurellales bacterium]|nr:MAG: DUF3223 domain-containing protein [Desulfurellales bacterium]
MSNRKCFVVNGESFKTKKELQDRVRSILWAYRHGDIVNMFDAPFLTELFGMHPSAVQKIGCGIAAIEVRRNPVYTNTQGFWIIRLDGSETDISYLECLTETPHHKRFERACRVAVEPSIIKFKQQAFDAAGGKLRCPFTGDWLSFAGAHVDHIAPKTFQSMLADFVRKHGIDVESVKVNGKCVDGAIQDTLDNAGLEQSWIQYHDALADLRVVSRTGNLSHAKKVSA